MRPVFYVEIKGILVESLMDLIIDSLSLFGATMSDIKKVVLAYSGGLDTSVICKWIQVY